MSSRIRKTLAYLGSIMLAGGLLYLALLGVDLHAVGQALEEADYRWLLPLIGIALLSHLIRAWRWRILLEALPQFDDRRPSLKIAFYSIMIGYMVNYVAPRFGELARTANATVQEKLSFSSTLGTVVSERALDVAVLALALLSLPLLLLDRLGTLHTIFVEPATRKIGELPLVGLVLLALGLIILLLGFYYLIVRSAWAGRLWREHGHPAWRSFRDGLYTLWTARRPGAILLSTLAMWSCYLLLAYVPLVMLGLSGTYELDMLAAWTLLVLGSVGIAIPTPGGIGSYHYITIQALVFLFAVPEAPAASYAVLAHGAQLILYVLVGLLCLFLQGTGWRALRRSATKRASQ